MRDAKRNGVGRGPTPGCGAIEWFVANESDRVLDDAGVLRWEDWCGHPVNEAEYVSVVEMCQQMQGLPAPSIVRREDLVTDALAELGAEF